MEGYAENVVQKKLNAKDRMPVVASVVVAVIGFSVWSLYAGWVGPTILIIGIALVIYTATRQELEHEYIFVNDDCEVFKIIKRESRKQIYHFQTGSVQRVMPYQSVRFENERQANPAMVMRDFTSGYSETKDNWYVFLNNDKNRTEAVVLELNDRCAEHVKLFYKDKYVE